MRKTILLLLVALAAGCGGSGGGGSEVNTQTEFGTSSGADFELFADEYSFAPPFLLIPEPGTYTLSLRNDGSEVHNFTLEGLGETGDVQPGETKTVELTFAEAGTFEFTCTVGDHAAQGQFGTLNVQAGAS